MASAFKKYITKANIYIRLFLLLPILFFFNETNAQPEIEISSAYRQFLNFQLDSSRQSLIHTTASPFAFYLETLLTSTNIYIEDNYDQYKSSKNLEPKQLEKLSELNFSDVYTKFLKSEIKLQWAILKLKNGEDFSSFWSLKQAYYIAKENVSQNPEFLPSYKTLGLLHVLFGVLPDKYNWILSLFGIKGDVKEGLSELEKVYKSSNFLSQECGVTLALLQAYLFNASGVGADLMSVIHEKKRHLLIDYAYALILMKNSQSEMAFSIINEAENLYEQPFLLPQLYYLQGEILLQKGLMDEAIKNYQLFLSKHSGQNLVKDTYFKIGICYLIMDQLEPAEKHFEESRQKGWAKNEADKNAENALETQYFSTKELYQLRYATDGGFYENALNIYGQIDTMNLDAHSRCELYYRSARLFHKTGKIKKAVSAYQKTITSQKNENWYFAPNSALQLGLIYISKKNNEAAIKYLHLVNDYQGYPYQYSIRQKTKNTLKKIN